MASLTSVCSHHFWEWKGKGSKGKEKKGWGENGEEKEGDMLQGLLRVVRPALERNNDFGPYFWFSKRLNDT